MTLQDKLSQKSVAPETAKSADIKKTEDALEAKAAHIIALEQGLRVFRKERLNHVILADGRLVKPTQEGYFIGITPEIESHLVHHATTQFGQVEEVLKETKQ